MAETPTQEVERYRLGGNHASMGKHPDGPYVKFEDHQRLLRAVEEERQQWKRAANGDRDGVLTYQHHLHVVDALVAERKAAESQLEELAAALEGRIKRALDYGAETAERAMDAPPEPDSGQDLVAASAAGEAVRGTCEQLLHLLRDKGTKKCNAGKEMPGDAIPNCSSRGMARRDRVVVPLANFLLRCFASPGYRQRVEALLRLGMERADELAREQNQ